MGSIRQFLMRHAAFGAWLALFALLLRAAVPAGYMVDEVGGRLTFELCSGTTTMPMGHPDRDNHHGHDRSCAFATLAVPALGGADPVLLAAAIAFVAAGPIRAVVVQTPPAAPRLRPPLRGPPLRS